MFGALIENITNKLKNRRINKKLSEYQNSLGNNYSVYLGDTEYQGEKTKCIYVYSTDRFGSITLFENNSAVETKIETLMMRQCTDQDFENTMTAMCDNVNNRNKLTYDGAMNTIEKLLNEYSDDAELIEYSLSAMHKVMA